MDDYHYFQTGHMPQYKSRVERQIGGLLTDRRIPFIYEKPTAVIDNGLTKIWHPDYSLQYGLLIEYFGVNGDQSYTRQAQHKLRVYHENQYDVIPVYPPDITGPWERNLLDRIGYTLERRLTDYREKVG
jgi:hypothetical protein